MTKTKKNVKKVTKPTAKKHAVKKAVSKPKGGLTLTKPSVKIEDAMSMAGSGAVYVTVPGSGINVRRTSEGVRVHVKRTVVRMRDNYVAFDLDKDTFKALVYALLKG